MKKPGVNKKDIHSSLDELHDEIGNISIPAPSKEMDSRFQMMLNEEKKKNLIGETVLEQKRSFFQRIPSPLWRIAAGIGLFLLGWFGASWFGIGNREKGQLANLGGEVVKLRETLILAMIDQNSPMERIKAVNMVSQMEQVDDKIIQSLLTTLENDNNDNVRLIALDALTRYTDKPVVRESLIHAIAKQTSPIVQLRLAEIMVSLHEKRSVPEFEKILNNVNLNYSLRNKLDETVKTLI